MKVEIEVSLTWQAMMDEIEKRLIELDDDRWEIKTSGAVLSYRERERRMDTIECAISAYQRARTCLCEVPGILRDE